MEASHPCVNCLSFPLYILFLILLSSSNVFLDTDEGLVSLKLPEWFYCKPHTCILTAYWEGSPSKYSPWAAIYLAQRCCHCWKHFGTPVVEQLSVPSSHFFGYLQHPEILVPFKADFIFGNSKKSFRDKSGEQGECSISVIDFWARNCLAESALWAGELSW
jgi:hypothetical protein